MISHSTLLHTGAELSAPVLVKEYNGRWLTWIGDANSHVATYLTADECDAIAESFRTLADEIRDHEEAHE